MLYRTSKVYWAQGLNLVVFDPKTEGISQIGQPSIWDRVQHGGGDCFEPVWYEGTPVP